MSGETESRRFLVNRWKMHSYFIFVLTTL